MLTTRKNGSASTMSIPCVLNRASLGDAEYTYVVLLDLFGRKNKVAWVRRADLEIEKQAFQGKEVRARLKVPIKEVAADRFVVSLFNDGAEETVEVAKPRLLKSVA